MHPIQRNESFCGTFRKNKGVTRKRNPLFYLVRQPLSQKRVNTLFLLFFTFIKIFMPSDLSS